MESKSNEEELTSTMGNLMSSSNEKHDSSDSTPTSSTDAFTTTSTSQIAVDDPISSTSSDIIEMKRNTEKTEDITQTFTSVVSNSIIISEKMPSPIVSEKDLLDMNITDTSIEKITENVDDIVQDLENLLGEPTTSFDFTKKTRKDESETEMDIDDFSAQLKQLSDQVQFTETPKITERKILEFSKNVEEKIETVIESSDVTSTLQKSEEIEEQPENKKPLEHFDAIGMEVETSVHETAPQNISEGETIKIVGEESEIGDHAANQKLDFSEIIEPPNVEEVQPQNPEEEKLEIQNISPEAVTEKTEEELEIKQDETSDFIGESQKEISFEPETSRDESGTEQEIKETLQIATTVKLELENRVMELERKSEAPNEDVVMEPDHFDSEAPNVGTSEFVIEETPREIPTADVHLGEVPDKKETFESKTQNIEISGTEDGSEVAISEKLESVEVARSESEIEPLEVAVANSEVESARSEVETAKEVVETEKSDVETIRSEVETAKLEVEIIKSVVEQTKTKIETENVEIFKEVDKTFEAKAELQSAKVLESEVDPPQPEINEDVIEERESIQDVDEVVMKPVEVIVDKKEEIDDTITEEKGETLEAKVTSLEESKEAEFEVFANPPADILQETFDIIEDQTEKADLVTVATEVTKDEIEEDTNEERCLEESVDTPLVNILPQSLETIEDSVETPIPNILPQSSDTIEDKEKEIVAVAAELEEKFEVETPYLEVPKELDFESASITEIPEIIPAELPSSSIDLDLLLKTTVEEVESKEPIEQGDLEVLNAISTLDSYKTEPERSSDNQQFETPVISEQLDQVADDNLETLLAVANLQNDFVQPEDLACDLIEEEKKVPVEPPKIEEKLTPLIISIDDTEKERVYSPKITIKPIKPPEEEEEVEETTKGSLKMTITKQSDNTHSILKIYNPEDDHEALPKLIIKPIVEQPQSPKTSKSSKVFSPSSTSSPRITIKPILKPEELVAPLKITIKPVLKTDEIKQKHSPKLTIKPILKPEEEIVEPKVQSPRVTIKPIVKPPEDEQTPRITIKPIKPVEQERSSPKITIKPIVKPQDEPEIDDDSIKERIVLKINKGTIPPKKEEEKLTKIKLKFSKEGGHPQIVQEKRQAEPIDYDKMKRQRIENESFSGITPSTHSKLKEMLSRGSEKVVTIEDDDDDVTIVEEMVKDSPIVISEESNQDSMNVEMRDPISEIPVFEITPESVKIQKVEEVVPTLPPAPRKRGRPRKVPLQVREDFKDPKEEEPKPIVIESSRPKRSCRGQSVRTTLGIKPRKPRGPGRGRGSKRGMGTRATPTPPPTPPRIIKETKLKEDTFLLNDKNVMKNLELDDGNILRAPSENLTDRADIVMYEEETRMSAETSSRAQTPAKQVVTIPTVDLVEESQSSVLSTATTESVKVRKGPRLEVHQEPEGAVISADQLAEYYWMGGGPYMLQEQVAQFLGIKSFKRKYPNIQRRVVDMQERDFIRESGLACESMCDLGLTAVNSTDILDIMYSDFQDKYEEYCKHQRDRQAKDLINKQKALTLAASQEKAKLDITQQAVQSAANWNATFNKARREQRKACMDLQTLTIHFPKGKMKQINKPKIGYYPIALVPGQYTDYYREFTPTEINNLPLNTICYDRVLRDRHDMECDSQTDGSGSESETSTSDSDSSYSGSSDGEDCTLCKHTPKRITA